MTRYASFRQLVWPALLILAGCGNNLLGNVVGAGIGGSAVASAGVSAPSGGEPENTAPPVDALDNAAHPGIEACATGDVSANLAIAQALKQSIHELVICGGMAQRFSMSFVNLFPNTARKQSTRPPGFRYVGNGTYQLNDVMTVTLTLPFATSFGQPGDVIPFDVFDTANYFADLKVVLRGTADTTGTARAELGLSFESVGPGFELLGVQPQGDKQLTMDVDALIQALGKIEMSQKVAVDDTHGDVHIVYHAIGTGIPISGLLFAAAPATMRIVDVTAENKTTGQSIDVTEWGMDYSGGAAGTLDGTVNFAVRGGDFDWAGSFVYPHRKTPDVTLSCL